jgi:hypothetical protein
VARRTARDLVAGGSRARWFGRIAARALPVYAGAWALALASSFLVLLSLTGTSATELEALGGAAPLPLGRQVLLWSGLSLFLGIFVGLLAQGRGMFETSADRQDAGFHPGGSPSAQAAPAHLGRHPSAGPCDTPSARGGRPAPAANAAKEGGS